MQQEQNTSKATVIMVSPELRSEHAGGMLDKIEFYDNPAFRRALGVNLEDYLDLKIEKHDGTNRNQGR